jgi:hypothetical protein
MLGYVTIEKSELKVREYDVYQAYYCGICKAVAGRIGQLPRLMLSYDVVFLAMVLDGLSPETASIRQEHCITHHMVKKPILYGSPAVDYAADVMVMLAYEKCLDDWQDERKKSALAGKLALGRGYRSLSAKHEGVSRQIGKALETLSTMEKAHSGNIDLTSDTFGSVMEALFTGFFSPDAAAEPAHGAQMRILGQLGRCLGRWIYLIDALDDYEEDQAKGTYNPFLYREQGLDGIEELLYFHLAEITKAYDLLDIKKNQGILENILFLGLRARTDSVLGERNDNHE